MLAAAVAWVLFVPVADWLAHHDVGSAKAPLLQTARDAARGRLLTLGAGLFAAAALLFTARNFTLSREGQVTDRYTKAIEQLGSKELDVRIGGIYALERVGRDSARDHPAVTEVLSAFIRGHSREPWPVDPGDKKRPRPDVQAAITVVGRRVAKRDIQTINLTRATLAGATLAGANLAGANLAAADLLFADLRSANLAGADLGSADLTGADLTGADLTGADLVGADLTGANLVGASLAGVVFTDANLTRADLTGVTGVVHHRTGTQPTISDATLTDVIWSADTPTPEGYKLAAGSRRLEWAGYESESSEPS